MLLRLTHRIHTRPAYDNLVVEELAMNIKFISEGI